MDRQRSLLMILHSFRMSFSCMILVVSSRRRSGLKVLSHRRDASLRLEHYIFQWFLHTAALLRVLCEYIIEIEKVLIFLLIAFPHRVIARGPFTQTRCINAITKKLEPYIFQYFLHTSASRHVQCERIIKIYKVLFFPLIALTHCVIASRLCEQALKLKITAMHILL